MGLRHWSYRRTMSRLWNGGEPEAIYKLIDFEFILFTFIFLFSFLNIFFITLGAGKGEYKAVKNC